MSAPRGFSNELVAAMQQHVSDLKAWLLRPWHNVPLRQDEIQEVQQIYQRADAELYKLIASGKLHARQADSEHFRGSDGYRNPDR